MESNVAFPMSETSGRQRGRIMGTAQERPRTAPGAFTAFARFVLCGGAVGLASSFAVAALAARIPWILANALITVLSTLLATELHARFTFGAGNRATRRQHTQSAGFRSSRVRGDLRGDACPAPAGGDARHSGRAGRLPDGLRVRRLSPGSRCCAWSSSRATARRPWPPSTPSAPCTRPRPWPAPVSRPALRNSPGRPDHIPGPPPRAAAPGRVERAGRACGPRCRSAGSGDSDLAGGM